MQTAWCNIVKKDPGAGKDWRQEEEGTTEDEMVGWHHQLYEHEFEQNFGRRGRIGKPGVLQSMGSQRVEQDWETEQQQQILQSYSGQDSVAVVSKQKNRLMEQNAE